MKIKIDTSKKYMLDQQPDRFLELMGYLYSGHAETIARSREALEQFGVTVEDE